MARRTLTPVTRRPTYCCVQTYTPAEDWTHTNTQMNTNERVQFLDQLNSCKAKDGESTNSFYRIYRHGNTLRFHIIMQAEVVGFKIKTKSKDFHYEGASSDQLFGQHLFPTSGRIVITEGEQMLPLVTSYVRLAMVSLPHGAAAAKKDLQKTIPFLQGYQEIVLFFDNDEAGRRPLNLPPVLPAGRVRLLTRCTKMLAMHSS